MKRTMIALGVAAMALVAGALPAQAQAPSLATVLGHTRASDRALDRAVAEFDAHALGKGRADLRISRRQLGLAVSQTARLIANADSPAARLDAAHAVVAVARQTSASELALAGVDRALPKGSRLQRHVMHAAALDTVRTQRAIDQLNALMGSLPEHAQAGLSTALSKLTLTHRQAVSQLAGDTTSTRVGAIAKAIAAADLSADVRAQHHAINLLQAIAPMLPAQAQQGIAAALEAISGSLDAQAARMGTARAHAPRRLRPAISLAIVRAHRAAADAA